MKTKAQRGNMAVVQPSIDHFLQACGAVGPLTLEVTTADGTNAGRWSLPQPFALIGRHPRADVVLTDPQISKRHAYLQILASRIFWMDLESRAGVMRDGIPATMGWLGAGEAITIGPYQVRVTGGVREDIGPDRDLWPDPLQARMLPQDPLVREDLRLEFARPAPKLPRHRIHRVLTLIGRAATCRVRIADDQISRFHAALIQTSRGMWIIDLLSRTGITVNQQRQIRWSGLDVGDNLQVGPYPFRVRTTGTTGRDGDSPQGLGRTELAPLAAVQPPDLSRIPESSSLSAALPTAWPESSGQLVEAVLEPVLARLSRMQEHMFDQYHEAMMSMLQVVGSLHREQVGQVRQELERIQQLTRELQALQAQAAGTPPQRAGGPTPVAPKSTPSPDSPPDSTHLPGPRPTTMPADTLPDPAATAYHSLIIERMTAIRDERQNHWQKILGMVTGSNRS